MASGITVEEWSGASSVLTRTATITATTSSLTLQRDAVRFKEARWKIARAFIPEGFPGSVTSDYVPFQVWDTLQGLSTYIRCMLSTQALLSAIGVGEKSATVLGATFQWFLRDFTGMLGGVMFTLSQGSKLDANAKTWRLAADFMNDLGMLMDLISPMFPSAFVIIVCFGSISRSFTGVASGATRAALTQHFSLENNAADISAKEGSQETVATMVGMMLGMLLARITIGHPVAIWFSFLSLTMFHLYANYKAVCSLSLTTLNDQRGSILLQHFMETGQALSPQQVSLMEHIIPLWIWPWRSRKHKLLHCRVQLGTRVSTLRHSEMLELAKSPNSRQAKYLLLERKGSVEVIIHKESTSADILQSYIHALVVANSSTSIPSRRSESYLWIDKSYSIFMSKLQAVGWNMQRLLVPAVTYRAHWDCDLSREKDN